MIDFPYLFLYCSPESGTISRPIDTERSEDQPNMKTPSRKALREQVKNKDIAAVLSVPRGTLTAKQKKFAQALVLDGMTGADAYRTAYDTKARPKTVGDNASRLKADVRIQAEIAALERAKALSALHSAEALRSLVITSLTSALIDPDVKPATKIQAAKVLGAVTEVAAFTERKEITHVSSSSDLRDRIMQQLKTVILDASDATDVDADSLLAEISGDAEPHPTGTPPNPEWDSDAHMHTIPHKPSPQFSDPESSDLDPSEDPPLSSETQTPGGYISGENDGVAK